MGVAKSGGRHTHLPQKTLEKKVNLTELSQDAKKFFFDLIFNILILWAKCMPIDFEFQQVLFYILTNCQTYFIYLCIKKSFIPVCLRQKLYSTTKVMLCLCASKLNYVFIIGYVHCTFFFGSLIRSKVGFWQVSRSYWISSNF